jgi:hypothetical protein
MSKFDVRTTRSSVTRHVAELDATQMKLIIAAAVASQIGVDLSDGAVTCRCYLGRDNAIVHIDINHDKQPRAVTP